MRVLYLAQPGLLQPWYDDFRRALGAGGAVDLYDPQRPFPEQVRGAGAVVDQGGSVGTAAMYAAAAAAGVRLWQVLGTGLDHVDVAAIRATGMRLANTPGLFSAVALAEHALFLMLAFAKRLRESERHLHAGVFHTPMNEELYGRTLGLVGFGASARELATRARAFGMPLLALDAVPVSAADRDRYGLELAGSPADLEALLRRSDYVSLHVPLTPATRQMLGREQLAAMKPDAVLINVARGAVVDETALIEALRAGRIRGAGLDVFEGEPLPPDHPLLHLENVLATPHVAGSTDGTSRRRGAAAAENVKRVAAGLSPLYEIVGET